MSIPDYQTAMLPVLQALADGQVHKRQGIISIVTDHFELTDDERRELLPSGKTTVIGSRIGWALSYLKNGAVVESAKRGQYQLTGRGKQVLADGPDRVDVEYLRRFPEFDEFITRARAARPRTPKLVTTIEKQLEPSSATPDEALENAYENLRDTVEAELLDLVKSETSEFFEHLVVELLVKMGYGGSRQDAGQALGRVGDGGIDGIIKEDRLGLDTIYLQAKRWEGTVGRPEIQKFAGALQGHKAKKGVFITTSNFSKEAEHYATDIETKIVLIGGAQLVSLMFDFNVGVSPRSTYEVKTIDSDYFSDIE